MKRIVAYLKTLADDIDSASVKINDEGRVYLRWGITGEEDMTVEEFERRLEQL
jgi:hypothetical protein